MESFRQFVERSIVLDPPGFNDRCVVKVDGPGDKYVTNANIVFGIFSFGNLDQAMVYTRDGAREILATAKRFGHHKLSIYKLASS
jgi:hypothetical protein